MMPAFSQSSINKLATCDKKLWDLFQEVVKHFDCIILCGHRGEAEQNEAFENHFSQLKFPDSLHNKQPSLAVDVAPYIGGRPILNDREAACIFAGRVLQQADILGTPIRWGGDWNGNGLTTDNKFQDLFHFELKPLN